ncbi:MAG: hypothetical protein ACRD5L_05790 [Bryobacteraceae bacterium]
MKIGHFPSSPAARQAILVASLMMAWQVGAKTARDSLFLTVFEPKDLPSAIGASTIVALLVALLSAKLLRKFGPSRLIPSAFLVGAALHILEWVFRPLFPKPVSAFIYIHIVALGQMMLSGFWTLANERFDPREARKRFGQITAFGTLGALAGGLVADRVAVLGSSVMGSPGLLILLAVLQLACSAALFRFAPGRQAEKYGEGPSFPEMISGAPYLVLLAVFVLLVAMSAASLDYLFKYKAVEYFHKEPTLTRFFALFYAGTSVVTFGMQALMSGFWLRRFGPGRTVVTLPIAVAGASVFSLFMPGTISVIMSRAIEQLLRGSLYRSGYELFYTPMPAAEKRSIKTVIDIGADRLGESLAAATIKLLLGLGGEASVQPILAVTAVWSGVAVWLAFRLDKAYVTVLEKGLIRQTVAIAPEDAEDYATKSVVLRTSSGVSATGGEFHLPSGEAAPVIASTDPTLRRLTDLRSTDTMKVRAALQRSDPIDPLLVPQIIDLLGRDDVARLAHETLSKNVDRITGQLVDKLADSSVDFKIRRRIPRILAGSKSRLAWDGLFSQLHDDRFEIRQRCAKSLEKILQIHPAHRPEPPAVFEVVGKELAVSRGMLAKRAAPIAADHGPEDGDFMMVDEVLRERSSQNMTHIATLLGLVLPQQSVRLAFRALHTDDMKLRGVALEYLDSVLPKALREELSAQLEGPVPAPVQRGTQTEEALANLLDASPSIMMRLEELRVNPTDLRGKPASAPPKSASSREGGE